MGIRSTKATLKVFMVVKVEKGKVADFVWYSGCDFRRLNQWVKFTK